MINPTIYNISATADTFEVRCSNPTASNLSAVADLIFSKMEEEIWKPVKGYEGVYEVSNAGNVKSLFRLVSNGNGFRKVKEIILKSPSGGDGYPIVNLRINGTTKSVRVHLLVAYAFLGYIPIGRKIDVDHINGIKSDPRLENLRIVTHRFNNSVGFRKNSHLYTSKYVGVSWHQGRNKWRAAIRINGASKHLGYFINEIEAGLAYISALNNIQ